MISPDPLHEIVPMSPQKFLACYSAGAVPVFAVLGVDVLTLAEALAPGVAASALLWGTRQATCGQGREARVDR